MRRAVEDAILRAVERVAGWMEEVGLAVRLDAVGNLYGRWEGIEPDAPRALP